MPADPVILHYTLNPSQPPPDRPQAWDIEIKMEDLALKAKMTSVTVAGQKDEMKEIAAMDEKVQPFVQFPLTDSPASRPLPLFSLAEC